MPASTTKKSTTERKKQVKANQIARDKEMALKLGVTSSQIKASRVVSKAKRDSKKKQTK